MRKLPSFDHSLKLKCVHREFTQHTKSFLSEVHTEASMHTLSIIIPLRAGGMRNSYNLVGVTPSNHDISAIGGGYMHRKRS